MRKAFIIMMSLAAMLVASTGLKAQEIVITLEPGWNWISYPNAEAMDIASALGDFEPMEGDVIKSHFSNSTYSRGRWSGGVTHFIPGKGYKYYSMRTEDVEFVFAKPSSSVVATATPTDITATSAVAGGTVTVPEGTHVYLRGVCWGIEPNPDIDGDHTSEETGVGAFSSTLEGLTTGLTYYVRAYAVTDYGLAYGENLSFVANTSYEYVDLGLPSGLLWATCNVGANSPEEYGDYFAWGETQPKDTYNWSTYQHCMGSENTLTKYCNNSSYGYNGFTDDLTTLLPEDDVATANWGNDWRMPTQAEWQELIDNTTVTWTMLGDCVDVAIFTASNGNSLILPVAGYRDDMSESSGFISDGSFSVCWSSSLYTDFPDKAWIIDFGDGMYQDDRYIGHTVRAVRSAPQNNAPTGAINGKFTVNEDGDQVYFSQGNLQYIGSAETPYWKFADNQWDYFGDNGQGSARQNVDRDLFSWGTSGYDHGAICYQPWSTSQTNSEYNVYGGYTYNLYDQTGQADWGYNPISNGGNQENQWRTLTHEEWDCVFNTRSTTSGIRYAKANVNDVNGVILLPDGWSSDTYSLSNTNSSGSSYSSNVITISQWSALEQAGAVFLPAACNRNGTSVVGIDGDYWTASYYSSNTAWSVSFNNSGSFITNIIFGRYFGFSVRLVAPAEN